MNSDTNWEINGEILTKPKNSIFGWISLAFALAYTLGIAFNIFFMPSLMEIYTDEELAGLKDFIKAVHGWGFYAAIGFGAIGLFFKRKTLAIFGICIVFAAMGLVLLWLMAEGRLTIKFS